MSKDRKLFAVLIDADNIPAKYAESIMREITTFGEPALRRVYGDWSNPALVNWKAVVLELGMDAKHQTANTKNKNATDIGLVIDAMDILHKGRFGGFVLVSSDSDFTALANRLREDGVEVIGIGESKAPVSLRNVCNRFILIENISNEDSKLPQTDSIAEPIKQPVKVINMIKAAMRSIDPEGEWYDLGHLGNQLLRAKPDFDTRTHGRGKLSDLVAMLTPFELRRQEGHIQVRLKNNAKS